MIRAVLVILITSTIVNCQQTTTAPSGNWTLANSTTADNSTDSDAISNETTPDSLAVSPGGIAGIIIAGLVVLGVAVFLIIWFVHPACKERQEVAMERSKGHGEIVKGHVAKIKTKVKGGIDVLKTKMTPAAKRNNSGNKVGDATADNKPAVTKPVSAANVKLEERPPTRSSDSRDHTVTFESRPSSHSLSGTVSLQRNNSNSGAREPIGQGYGHLPPISQQQNY